MRKALSLSEVAMSLVIVAVVISIAAASFSHLRDKRRDNEFWEGLNTAVSVALRNSEATRITNNIPGTYGFVAAKGPYSNFFVNIFTHTSMDLMMSNLPEHICRKVVTNFSHPSLIYTRVGSAADASYVPNSTPDHCYDGSRILIALNWR